MAQKKAEYDEKLTEGARTAPEQQTTFEYLKDPFKDLFLQRLIILAVNKQQGRRKR